MNVLKMCKRPTNDWDLAPGSFLPLGMSSSTSQILLKAARTPNCGPLQTPTTGVKLDLGFLASVGQRTHTSAAKRPSKAARTHAAAVVQEALLVPQHALAALRVGALPSQVEAVGLQELAEREQVAWRRVGAARRGEMEGEGALTRHLARRVGV